MKFLNNIYHTVNSIKDVAIGIGYLSASAANLSQGVSNIAFGTVTSGLNGAIYLGARAYKIISDNPNRIVPEQINAEYIAEINDRQKRLESQFDLFKASTGTMVAGCNQVFSALGQSFLGIKLAACGASGLAMSSATIIKDGCGSAVSSGGLLIRGCDQILGCSQVGLKQGVELSRVLPTLSV